jgi:hypothetical protein
VAPLPEVYPPSTCPEDCRGARNAGKAWRWPAGRKPEKGQHHPLCPHDAAYRAKQRGDKRWMIYDLERRVEVREATATEVTQSELELSRSGTRSVAIAGRIYAVVQSGQVEPPREKKPLAGASVRRMQNTNLARHQARRAELLQQSQLPSVPQAYQSESEEVAELRARLAALEGRTMGQLPVGAPPVPLPPDALRPVPLPARAAPVTHPADHLRDGLGLVGHQQATDDIPPGPVMLTEPEPFVDPLAQRAATSSAARPPVDYHPGAVRPKTFVPPPPPGAPAQAEVDPAFSGGAPIDIDAGGDVDSTDADPSGDEASSDEPTDEEVERLIAEAAAAEAEVARLEAEQAEPDEGEDGYEGDDSGPDSGPDGEGEPLAAGGYEQPAAG